MEHEIEFAVRGYRGDFMAQYSLADCDEQELGEGKQVNWRPGDGKPVLESISYDGLTLDITDLPKNVAAACNGAIRADIEHRVEFVRVINSVPESAGLFYVGLRPLADVGRRLTNDKIRKTVHDMKKQISEAPNQMLEAIGADAYRYFNNYQL